MEFLYAYLIVGFILGLLSESIIRSNYWKPPLIETVFVFLLITLAWPYFLCLVLYKRYMS